MTRPTSKPATRRDWSALAASAARSGDLKGARAALAEAVRQDPRNPQLHCDYAAVLTSLDEIDEAAVALTRALRLRPQHEEAARRLSRLLARFEIDQPGQLDPFGLRAALNHAAVDGQPIVIAAFRQLAASNSDLAEGLAEVRAGRALDAGRKLVRHRTSELLKSELLLAALHSGVVMDADLERLLSAVRRCLLIETDLARFEDRSLTAFAIALLAQCWNNDHAWAESEMESARLEEITLDERALLAGDLNAGRALLLRGLYRPLTDVLAVSDPESCRSIRPKPLREILIAELSRLRQQKAARDSLSRLTPLSDETSRRVAGQYESSPYPRWQSLHVSAPGTMKASLARYFEPSRLAFMDGPFDVLIAGAGTGKQALQSAFAYGPQARVLATDISAASLGYAVLGAERYNASNVEFLIADILDLDRLNRQFDIVECVGVLHHMADPWTGWRKLLSCLKPGGLMYIGLYSAVSRANIRRLRAEPHYPGPGCDDASARAYRATLMARQQGEPGYELKASHDFYTLHGFRDLALHENEMPTTLPEIARFLNENGLVFRGFTLEAAVVDSFASRSSDFRWPGTLQDWDAFEHSRPETFDGMYRFWCDRVAPGL